MAAQVTIAIRGGKITLNTVPKGIFIIDDTINTHTAIGGIMSIVLCYPLEKVLTNLLDCHKFLASFSARK